MHAYTYSAHPVGCAVALRVLEIIRDEDFVGQAAAKGRALLERLTAALGDHPFVGNIRGKGLMCAVELVQDRASRQSFPATDGIGRQVQLRALDRGLFSRVKGDSYLLAPPIVTTDVQLDRMVDILSAAVDDVLG